VERKSFRDMDCSVAQCLEVIGEWWTMLIVRDAFLGVKRFDTFQRRLGISRNVLQQRLENLVTAGVMERVAYSEHPVRYDYVLSPKGRDLWPVLNAMRQWGDTYAAPHGAPLNLVHTVCQHQTVATPVCSHCGETLDSRNVRAVAGAGRTASWLPARSQSPTASI
jgi:DNA-binding HxlR family transcriptional regulator